jgi:hypothetical protein
MKFSSLNPTAKIVARYKVRNKLIEEIILYNDFAELEPFQKEIDKLISSDGNLSRREQLPKHRVAINHLIEHNHKFKQTFHQLVENICNGNTEFVYHDTLIIEL